MADADADEAILFDDDDDDDMANLFSFGADSTTTEPLNELDADKKEVHASNHKRSSSDDSFLNLLAAEGGGAEPLTGATDTHDQPTQDILEWLDTDNDDDARGKEKTEQQQQVDETAVSSSEVSPPPPATIVQLPPVFTTVQEALDSDQSTTEQIRQLLIGSNTTTIVDDSLRADLYCRLQCHRRLVDAAHGSLADSFQNWTIASEDNDFLQRQALLLSERVGCNAHDLTKLLLYHQNHHRSSSNGNTTIDTTQEVSTKAKEPQDLLLPPVAATLLATNMPVAAASVVLGQVIANHMPLLALPPTEQWDASLTLHAELYLMAAYHLPLLVFHLDRYLPGWYWPKLPTVNNNNNNTTGAIEPEASRYRNLQHHGHVPPSWLLSHFAGECNGSFLDVTTILQIWDRTLTRTTDPGIRFFLALAVLEQASDELLLLTGDELVRKLESAIQLKNNDGDNSVTEWWKRAEMLQDSTPESVLLKLSKAEDTAMTATLKLREEKAQADLTARLEAEAAVNRQAQERKAEAARERLTRARLVAFYRKHAPDKESNIEKILSTYAGNFEVLDAKLKKKYGEGFNPPVPPKTQTPATAAKIPITNALTGNANKLLLSMNQGIGTRKLNGASDMEESFHARPSETVTVSVTAAEVLPVVCWTASAAQARVERYKQGKSWLRFYLVDCRTEAAVEEQGKFPTATALGPQTMLDPDLLQSSEEQFEVIRGAVHIVVMGEGYAALPTLYGQKLTQKLQEAMETDESRTNMCALFFIKRGYPFVSVLNGGFAAAHSWLVREGSHHGLKPSLALVDYDPERSLFGQLETLHNASTAERAQRRMQSVLDKSLIAMSRVEQFANSLDEVDSSAGFRNLFRKISSSTDSTSLPKVDEAKVTPTKADGQGLKGLFSNMANSMENEQLALTEEAPASSPALSDGQSASPNDDESESKINSPENDKAADDKNALPTSPFKSLGFGRQQPSAEEKPQVGFLSRNPFARFGSSASASQESNKPEGSESGGFVFSKLRQQAFGRLRADNTGPEHAASESVPTPTNNSLEKPSVPTKESTKATGLSVTEVTKSEDGAIFEEESTTGKNSGEAPLPIAEKPEKPIVQQV